MNFSYLVWNRPKCICGDRDRFETIQRNCGAYGIGLITIHDPKNLSTFEIRLSAQREDVAADEIDEFVTSRFDATKQDMIVDALRRYCPGPL